MTESMVAPVGDPEPAPEPVKAKAAPEKIQLTDYIVLVKTGDHWEEAARIVGRSAENAIREAAEKMAGTRPTDAPTFVAIPARSFKPVVVRTKTVTSLVIEGAS